MSLRSQRLSASDSEVPVGRSFSLLGYQFLIRLVPRTMLMNKTTNAEASDGKNT